MLALGRLFNYIHLADNVYIKVQPGEAVGFLCYLAAAAGDTYTLTEAKTAAGGSAQALAKFTVYFTSTGDGTDAWVRRTQAAASTIVTAAAAAQNGMYCWVEGSQLSDTYKYVKLASTGAGLVTALGHDLVVQRTPANLAILGT